MPVATIGNNPIANMTTVESLIKNDEPLPPGIIHVQSTPAYRGVTLNQSCRIRSQGHTILKLGPDKLGEPGFDHKNYEWWLLKVKDASQVDISGIELQAPNVDYSSKPEGSFAYPVAFDVEKSNINRRIDWDRPRIIGEFVHGIYLHGRTTGSARTALYVKDAVVLGSDQGFLAYQDGLILDIDGLTMVSGGGGYTHQSAEVNVRRFDITSQRGGWKDAGVGAEGGSAHGSFVNGIFRGVGDHADGLDLDRFADRHVQGVTFDETLDVGIRLYGKASSRNNVFHCKRAFDTTGDRTGGNPIISSIGDQFLGVRSVWECYLADSTCIFDSFVVETDKAGYLWALDVHPLARNMRMYLRGHVRAGDVEAVVQPRNGRWTLDGVDMSVRTANLGLMGTGPEEFGSLSVNGGIRTGAEEFHHSMTPANRARVKIRE